jgi:DNA repair protein RadC
MPILPDGTYPQMVERIGTAQQLMVRPNPAKSGEARFQQLRLPTPRVTPKTMPKWFRQDIKEFLTKPGFTGAADVFATIGPEATSWPQEHFIVIPVNVKNKPLAVIELTIGTLDASLVHPRDVFMAGIATAAAALILVHNHPSGDPEPSAEDIALTRRIADAGELLGFPVLDHVILGRDGYVSLAERGVL